jgi:hypothetical protein
MHGRGFAGLLFSLIAFLVIFLAPVFAGPPPPKSEAPVCGSVAEGFLDARLEIWQRRMNLSDWKISLVMSPASALKPRTLGNIHWDTARKTAVIRVLDAADYKMSCHDMLADMETTLVHELVHLELSALPRPAASRHEEELAVNRIAAALLKLDRENPPAGTQ